MSVPNYLKKYRRKIASIQPENQIIPYREYHWDRYFSKHEIYREICRETPNNISRGYLFKLSLNVRNDREINKLFIASMMWGYGTVGYAAYRTCKMISSACFTSTIRRTYDLLQKGKVQEAYDAIDIPFCGSAFFTKFFYFSGYAIKDQFCYLILDSMVAKCLERLLGKSETKNFCKVLRNKEGQISSVGKFAHGYKCYLDLMQFWAKKLDCSPDAIELFMFSQM